MTHASDARRTAPDPCPTWCTSGHPQPEPDKHGEWYVEHASDDLAVFTTTSGDHVLPVLGTVSTSAFVCDSPAHDEPRRVAVNITTDSSSFAWLTPEQARVLAGHLLAAAQDIEAGR